MLQINFEVPPEIEIGLKTGVFNRFGGVIRDSQDGSIVHHLKEVGSSFDDSDGSLKSLGVLKTLGIVALACTIVGLIVLAYRKIRSKSIPVPRFAAEFNQAMGQYFAAISAGNLSLPIIDHLLSATKRVKKSLGKNKENLRIPTFEWSQAVYHIHNYTSQLAWTNNVSTRNLNPPSTNFIVDLQNYLKFQKHIIKIAA